MKKQQNITIDIEIYQELKRLNLNISNIVNSYLRHYIGLDRKDDNVRLSLADLEAESTKAMAKALKLKERVDTEKKRIKEEAEGWLDPEELLKDFH